MTGMNLTEIIDAAGARHGARIAISCKGETLTYGDLRSALGYFDSAVPYLAGARVAVALVDSLACCLLYLHLFERGATAIPVSVRATGTQLASILARAEPHYAVTSNGFYGRHRSVLSAYDCLVVDAAATAQPTFSPRQKADRDVDPSFDGRLLGGPAEVRAIMFTSGSTGTPKGVCLSEANVLAAAGMMAEFLDLGPDRRTVVTPPMYDYYGYIQIFGHALRGAGCIFGESAAFPESLGRVIDGGEATDLAVVPFTLRLLLALAKKQLRPTFAALRYLTSSSDVLTSDLLNRLLALNPRLVVYNIYGLTEAGRACSRRITAGTPHSSSIGLPSPAVEITIDGDRERPGEIVIRGPNVAGFLRSVSDNRLEVSPNDRIETGDLGYFDESGEIVLVGRKDHMLNVMGEKLHPSEIESVALQLSGVNDALARAARDPSGDVRVVLDVVCDGLDERIAELHRLLRTQLPRAFVPTEIRTVPRIARTDIGSKAKRGSTAA
jgi:acyl-CoA synthetase (AMP-forming)/AMP-acid ligase II